MKMFEDPAVKAIFCARGGYGSMRLLPHLEFDVIRNHPKIFVGFSDVTALLAVLYRQCGFVTFHGPVVASLPSNDKESLDALISAISGEKPVELVANRGTAVRPGRGTGPVLAGNLTTMCHLIGTPYQPETKGHILLFEERGEAPYRLDRMLTQMHLAGFMKDIAGVAFGSFEACGEPDELTRVIEEQFISVPYPVLAGLEFGHGERNMTTPVGLKATLDADSGRLSYHDAATVA
jgi:muramoyltetrapeptide carboxypeptidase